MRHITCEVLEGRVFLNAVPVGPEFLVNGTTLGDQDAPAVASDATGAFVVAWQDSGSGGEQIKARLFDAAGTPRGAEFRVDTAAPGQRSLVPAVAMDNDGDFVVAWLNEGDSQIYVRRYNTAGQALGDPFAVGPGDVASRPAVAMDGDGDFAIVTGAFFNGALKLYSSSGTLTGSVLLQPHSDNAALTGSSVAMDDAGNITVEWIEQDNNVPSPNAYRQPFSPDGTPTGPSSFILGSRALTPLPFDIVVVKNGTGAGADVINTNVGTYGSVGIVSESEFHGTESPSAAVAEDGTLVLSFVRAGFLGSGTPMTLARRYDASGKALGDEFVLPGMSGGVALAPLPGGGFVAVDSEVSPLAGGGSDVHARLFAPALKPAEVDRVYVRGAGLPASATPPAAPLTRCRCRGPT